MSTDDNTIQNQQSEKLNHSYEEIEDKAICDFPGDPFLESELKKIEEERKQKGISDYSEIERESEAWEPFGLAFRVLNSDGSVLFYANGVTELKKKLINLKNR